MIRERLGELEQMVLLAALRLDEGAYGVSIRLEIERRTGRSLTVLIGLGAAAAESRALQ